MSFLAFAGPPEVWVILMIVVILFGAKKLPALARAMGSSINQFKQGLADEQGKPDQLGESEQTGDGESGKE
jgi:sec-independent protein translocase protein TatA